MTFGQWLKLKRKEKGLTQAELASLVQLSLPYISKLERDQPHTESNAKPQPKVAVVDRLAKALGASAQEARERAFGGAVKVIGQAAERTQFLTPTEAKLLTHFRALPDARQIDAAAYVEMLFDRYGRK